MTSLIRICPGCICVLLQTWPVNTGIVSYSYRSATIGSTRIARRAGR